MAAYVILRIKSDDPSLLKEYQKVAPSIIEKYNGKFLARGGEVVTLEGSEESRRVVIIEFPSLDEAKKFYNSPEYVAVYKLLFLGSWISMTENKKMGLLFHKANKGLSFMKELFEVGKVVPVK